MRYSTEDENTKGITLCIQLRLDDTIQILGEQYNYVWYSYISKVKRFSLIDNLLEPQYSEDIENSQEML